MTATANAPLTKNQRRRIKKKQEKQRQHQAKVDINVEEKNIQDNEQTNGTTSPQVEIEYVSMNIQEDLALPEEDPAYEEFMRIFNKFSSAEELCGRGITTDEDSTDKTGSMDHNQNPEDDNQEDIETSEQHLSRKERKKGKRLTVAELKQLVPYPDAVEAHDVTSADPRLLVYLKSYRNTVPVPRHWCHKRKYLQGKRGVEKQPFLLPEFIANTGIAEIRSVVGEDDDKKKSKQKMRERMQPKMGRVDIDYQVLHDAFFRFQTKPSLTILGDLYYEGKEFEVKLKAKVPGHLSEELKQALGMVDGVPPPWLLNMQRYGPPPAYPNLKIPGLNAPIPEGASFGYHPGGWGKPPVDENGQPLYGDVFAKPVQAENLGEQVNRERWGELEVVETAEEEEEEEEEVETVNPSLQGQLDATGMETPLADGIVSVSSIASGLTTPGGVVDMRKGIRGTDTPEVAQQLYTVLEQKETSVGTSLYGSGHGYVVPGTESSTRSVTGRVRRRFEDVPPESSTPSGEVSVAPSSVADDEDDDAARKKKKAKSEKNKKLKDFKF